MPCTNKYNAKTNSKLLLSCSASLKTEFSDHIVQSAFSHWPFAPGGARLITHQRGHPRGLGQDGVVPWSHVSQRRAARPAEGPAEGVDVEPDPGERAAPLPEPPQRPGHPATPAGEGDQGLHIAGPGCRPAPQSLLLIIVLVAINWADQQLDKVTHLHRKRPLGSPLHLELLKWIQLSAGTWVCMRYCITWDTDFKNSSVWWVLWDALRSSKSWEWNRISWDHVRLF